MRTRLQKILQINPGELLLIGLAAGLFFLWEAGRELGSQTATTLFINRAGPDKLPYMYIGLGLGNVLASFVYSFSLAKLGSRISVAIFPLALAGILLAEYAFVPHEVGQINIPTGITQVALIFPLLWLSVNVGGGLLGTLGWGIAGQLLDTRQAKRLFSLIASAGLLGVIAAAALVRLLSGVYRAHIARLVFWQVGFILVGVIVAQFLMANRERRQGLPDAKSMAITLRLGAETVFQSRLLSLVATSLVLFSILFLTLDLIFNETVNNAFVLEAEKLEYFASFNAIIQGVTLVISLFLTGRLVRRWGIVNMNFLLVAAYLVSFALLIINANLMTVSLARLLQLVTLGGVVQSSNYIFFNIVPAEKRSHALSFTFGVIGQVGIVLSGLLLLGNRLVPRPTLLFLGIAISLACGLVTFWMRNGYRAALLDALRAGQIEVFDTGIHSNAQHRLPADPATFRFLVNSLADPNPIARRLAAEMLGEVGEDSAIPRLVICMADPDSGVRASALRTLHLLQYGNAARWSLETLHDPAPEVQAIALQTLADSRTRLPKQMASQLNRLLGADDLEIRLGALKLLAVQGETRRCRAALREILQRKDPFERALGLSALPDLVEILRPQGADPGTLITAHDLTRFLHDSTPAVRRSACEAAAAVRHPRLLQELIRLLDDPVAAVRKAAALALRAFGEHSEPALLSLLQTDSKAEILQSALLGLVPNKERLEPHLRVYALKEIERLRAWRQRAGSLAVDGRAASLLDDFMRDEIVNCEVRLIRALQALEPEDSSEWEFVIRGLNSGNPEQRAAVLETLDTLGDTDTAKHVILPALEESALAEGYFEDETHLHPAAALRQLLASGDRWTQALAMAVASELELDVLTAEIAQFSRKQDPLLREASRAALRRLKKGKPMARKTLQTLSSVERIILLREVPLFQTLEIHDLKRLAEIASEKLFQKGEYVVHQGDSGDELYIIADGEVEIWLNTGRKQERVSQGKTGDFFGEMAVLDSAPRSASIRAASPVRMLVLDGEEFKAILRDRPEVALTLLRGLSQRIRFANDLLTPGKPRP
ncbi:MAG: MFS transporter [Chloroflexi bacterium]|nr:MFS transporter [Chloroflexota bacterium]